MSGLTRRGTDPPGKFLRAQVRQGGGVTSAAWPRGSFLAVREAGHSRARAACFSWWVVMVDAAMVDELAPVAGSPLHLVAVARASRREGL